MIGKIYVMFGVFLLSASLIGAAFGQEYKLQQADSLFAQGKYTESYELYDQLFFNDNVYSPQMLLKLAYITEGLGEYERALFFLQTYYRKTYDDLALNKIQKISETYGLSGYSMNDLTYALDKVGRFRVEIIYSLLILQAILLLLVAYKKYKLRAKPLYSVISAAIVGVLLIVMINFVSIQSSAIIASNKTYLMKGPSAGADLLTIIDKGHNVELLDQGEVWSKIKLDENVVYIRSNRLMPL